MNQDLDSIINSIQHLIPGIMVRKLDLKQEGYLSETGFLLRELEMIAQKRQGSTLVLFGFIAN